MKTLAVVSMLHEPATRNSAVRLIHEKLVLARTHARVISTRGVSGAAVLCWDDQEAAVRDAGATSRSVGPRRALAALDGVSASRRWADGWRGGLLGACEFDRGFVPMFVLQALRASDADAALILDPAACLCDPSLLADVIDRLAIGNSEFAFTQAAPGLAGVALKRSLVERLSAVQCHFGRLLGFMPDQLMRDPIGTEACVPVPTRVARATQRFTIDTDEQAARLATLAEETDAEKLVERVMTLPARRAALPRDVTIELTTRTSLRPVWLPAPQPAYDMPFERAERLLKELAAREDIRVTFAGRGDPLLHPAFSDIVRRAAAALAMPGMHVRTNFNDVSEAALSALVEAGVDVLSLLVPAASAATYTRVTGGGTLSDVLGNVRRFVAARGERGTPVLAPVFVKLKDNLDEMEAWYDQWLRAVGSAVIEAPSGCQAAQRHAVADMQPPRRSACRRLDDRLTIHADGTVVTCEQDDEARQPLGHVDRATLSQIWLNEAADLHTLHRLGQWTSLPVCAGCTEWHRP